MAVTEGLLREICTIVWREGLHSRAVAPRPRPDIELLANPFLVHYWRKYRGVDAGARPSNPARRQAARPSAAGQRTELQNVIEHAVVLLDDDERDPRRGPAVSEHTAPAKAGTGLTSCSALVSPIITRPGIACSRRSIGNS
jgi:hypothetical protein